MVAIRIAISAAKYVDKSILYIFGLFAQTKRANLIFCWNYHLDIMVVSDFENFL